MSPEEREQKVSELIIKACNIARESEREACARIAELLSEGLVNPVGAHGQSIATAIRAKGTK